MLVTHTLSSLRDDMNRIKHVRAVQSRLFEPPQSGEGSLGGLKSRARYAGFSVMEIARRACAAMRVF